MGRRPEETRTYTCKSCGVDITLTTTLDMDDERFYVAHLCESKRSTGRSWHTCTVKKGVDKPAPTR